jgi:hypothetical protein
MTPHVQWRAAIGAGIAAGILATVVEVALWLALTGRVARILYRDARFAGRIVMGSSALSPADSRASIMLVATLVHFALSIVYAVIVARLTAGSGCTLRCLAGGVFGLALFIVNRYGLRALFRGSRRVVTGSTLAAHVAFGVVAAGAYRVAGPARARLIPRRSRLRRFAAPRGAEFDARDGLFASHVMGPKKPTGAGSGYHESALPARDS